MINPHQANGLKPAELVWLRETEAYIDKELQAKFGGAAVEIRVRDVPPLDRTFVVLTERYEQAGWNVSRHQLPGFVLLLFRPKVEVAVPRYEPMQKVTVDETVKTAWERINVEDT